MIPLYKPRREKSITNYWQQVSNKKFNVCTLCTQNICEYPSLLVVISMKLHTFTGARYEYNKKKYIMWPSTYYKKSLSQKSYYIIVNDTIKARAVCPLHLHGFFLHNRPKKYLLQFSSNV